MLISIPEPPLVLVNNRVRATGLKFESNCRVDARALGAMHPIILFLRGETLIFAITRHFITQAMACYK